MLLHTEAFTQRSFYTGAFTHRRFYTQHTNILKHELIYPQAFLIFFTQRPFYTQRLLQTDPLRRDASTHRGFDSLTHKGTHEQSTSQYYFVLQSLHKVLPSTTSYCKTCTKYFQYYFVGQSLHKVRPSTTSYCKACTKYFPVLLCTTKLAQSTSQYYFVLQNLHKVRPSTTSYYKTCTKYFSVLLHTTKLAQSTSQ